MGCQMNSFLKKSLCGLFYSIYCIYMYIYEYTNLCMEVYILETMC